MSPVNPIMTILLPPAPRALLRVVLCGAALLAPTLRAQETAPTAADLAARLSDALQDNSSTVRLKIESRPAAGAAKSVLQVQVKARRTKAATELVYTVLWPKERKGEAFLLRKSPNRPASGAVFTPPDSLRPLTAAQMQDGVFGSDLAYEDLVENFYAWEHQAIAGTETVDRVPCQILESKIGKGGRSTYARVRSWIDPKRMVPLRIEKYLASGELARRIETTRVAKDDTDRPVPASFSVQRAGKESVTELEGSNSRHDLTHADADFTPEALKAAAGAAGKAR
jgi:hypothetical protein